MNKHGHWLRALARASIAAIFLWVYGHATAGTLTATPASGTQINLSWSVSGGHSAIAVFANGAVLTTLAAYTTSYSHTGLANGTTVSYRVEAWEFVEGGGSVVDSTNTVT